ncbi:MAG: tetratricopeptide repeat protein [Acidobacteriaceae bacterium]
MIWLLALQLALPPQPRAVSPQQYYEKAKDDLSNMQFAAASEGVEAALHLDPNFVPALILKARLALFAHRPDIAKSCLIKAVIINPSSEDAQFFLGMFYYLQNDFSLGIAPLERAHDLSPQTALPLFYLAMTKEALGDGTVALDLYDEAEALSTAKTPQTASILVAHGRLLFSLGRFDESIGKDDLAIAADSQSRDAFYEKAKGLERIGKYQAAAAAGEKALTLPELGTSDSQVHFLLGKIYLKLNQPDLAQSHLAKFHAAPQTTQR